MQNFNIYKTNNETEILPLNNKLESKYKIWYVNKVRRFVRDSRKHSQYVGRAGRQTLRFDI